MATKRYTVEKRRKREKRTDYKLRINLLKSPKPRLVIRKSLKNIMIQIIKSENAQDKVIITTHSRELRKLGWNHSLSSIPAGYLTGFILGKKALKNNIKEAILDLGIQKSIMKSRLYATLKGCIDAGLKVNHDPKVFPEEDRIKGKHINKESDFEKIKSKI
jgi:large subunit ribosomal protein L18